MYAIHFQIYISQTIPQFVSRW